MKTIIKANPFTAYQYQEFVYAISTTTLFYSVKHMTTDKDGWLVVTFKYPRKDNEPINLLINEFVSQYHFSHGEFNILIER